MLSHTLPENVQNECSFFPEKCYEVLIVNNCHEICEIQF